ncbi:MAG TPA: permease-like cell division protein FtsX [Gammaproteobacteria bacterium]|nr:permease-like cell division protein FtsX [Gammaproteobacteria bacterium]
MSTTADRIRHRRADGPKFGPIRWLTRHAQVMVSTLGRLYRRPVSSLLSVTVIGIALALPAGLHVLIQNTRAISGSLEGAARISVFLQRNVTDNQRDALADVLRRREDVANVTVISAEQALAEFKALSGFGDAIDALEDNPLPAVLVVTPASADGAAVDALRTALAGFPETEIVQLDSEWLQRLNAILEIINRGILVLAGMFGVAVVIVVGNTIRLDIQNRREEIVVTKLVGGTDAFVRRPFLYMGFWYGAGGGVMAWLLTGIALLLMHEPVSRLAGLYGSGFRLEGLGFNGGLAVLGAGALLGWLGAMVAASQHLADIEPE